MAQQTTWPALESGACRDTLITLHLSAQVIGKLQSALTPSLAGWAQAPLRLTARGLATQLLWTGDRSMSIEFDFTRHELRFDLSDGAGRIMALEPRPVSEFYAGVMATLRELGVTVTIDPTSVEMPESVSCATDTTHRSYDRECVASLFQTWTRVAAVFDRFREGFRGRQTPVDLWWGTFDLSVARYSGRAASPPFDCGAIEREAMAAEESLVGSWPGDEQSPERGVLLIHLPQARRHRVGRSVARGRPLEPRSRRVHRALRCHPAGCGPVAGAARVLRVDHAAGARLGGWDRASLERRPSAERVA